MPKLNEPYVTTREAVNAIAQQAYYQGASQMMHKIMGRLSEFVPEGEVKKAFTDLVTEIRGKADTAQLPPFVDDVRGNAK